MKAEERKRLQSNALLDWLRRQRERLGANGNTYLAVACGVLLVSAVVFYFVYRHNTSVAATSHLLRLIDIEGETKDKLKKIAENTDSPEAARIASFHLARIALIADGINQLSAPTRDARNNAINSILEARDSYAKLATQCTDDPVLLREALFESARAEEALIGFPKQDKQDETYGTVERALELYKKARDAAPESFQGKEADKRIKEIEKDPAAVTAFYKQFYAALGSSDPMPGLPPGHPPVPSRPIPPLSIPPMPTTPLPTPPTASAPTPSPTTKATPTPAAGPPPTTKPLPTIPTAPQ